MTIEHENFGHPILEPDSDEEINFIEDEPFAYSDHSLDIYAEELTEDATIVVNKRSFTFPKGTLYGEISFSRNGFKSATLATGFKAFDGFFKAYDEQREKDKDSVPQYLHGSTNARLARFSAKLGFVSTDGVDLKKLDPENDRTDYSIGAMVDVVRARLEHFKEKQINGELVVDLLERRVDRYKTAEDRKMDEYWRDRGQELFLPTKNSGIRRGVGYAIDASVLGLAMIMLPEHVRDKDLILAGMYTFNAAVFSGRIIGRIRDKKVGII